MVERVGAVQPHRNVHIAEAAGVDLVDDGGLPPRLGHGVEARCTPEPPDQGDSRASLRAQRWFRAATTARGGDQLMSIGPVEYVILGFPDNKFTGQIVPELTKLVDDGLINIIDLTFITKDVDGNVDVVEFDMVEELAAFAGIDAEIGGILTDEDIAHAAVSLEPNTSAALLLWEDAWAARFTDAVRGANGVVLEGARIPHEYIDAAVDALAVAVASSS